MKKVLLVILLAAASFNLFAQIEDCQPKKTDNLYLGIGIGGMTVLNEGLNTPTFNANVQFGQYITPTYGWRVDVAGAWQTLDAQTSGFAMSNKPYGELNLDATINLFNLFGKRDWERKANLYIFGGPQVTLSSAVSMSQNVDYKWVGTQTTAGYTITVAPATINTHFVSEGALARVGASVGAGFNYNCSDKLAVKAEARYAVAPSIFGFGSDYALGEPTLRATVGVTYALTTKSHNPKPYVCPACPECPTVRCPEPEPCPVCEPVQVAAEVPNVAVFFKLNNSTISAEEAVKVVEFSKYIKENPNDMFTVTGYADKGTGTEQANKVVSQRRAQAVYNLLVKNGVSPKQLITIAAGGVGVMFNDDETYSRVAIVKAL